MKTLKYILSAYLIFVIVNNCTAQVLWSYHCGSDGTGPGGGVDNIDAIGTDNDNNTYLIADLEGPNTIFGNDTLYSPGFSPNYNITIAKFNSSGARVWVKRYGSAQSFGTYFDKFSNSLLIPGAFFNSSFIIGSDTLHAVNGSGILTKLDTAGNVLWVHQRTTTSGFLLTTDSSGNIYACGRLNNPATLDTIPLPKGIFMAKYDSTGNVIWAKKMFEIDGSTWKVTPKGMKVFNNEIYLTAETEGDTISIDGIDYFPPYTNSGALMKFTNDGNLVWLSTFGPNGLGNLAMDVYGNCYVPGGFQGTLHFGNDSISSQGATIYDGMLAKYDSTGHLLWLRQLHATVGAVLGEITSDSEGNCYMISRILGGTASFGSFTYTSSGTSLMFDNCVAKYNSAGDCIGVQQIGLTQYGGFGEIDRDNQDNVLVAGFYQNSITLGGTTYGNYGNNDIALAKMEAITDTQEGERKSNQLLIYANPNQGKCNITIPDEFKQDKNLTLSIYANDGKLIQQKKIEMNNDKIKLNLEAEAKGIYNVTLSNGLKSYSGKIVFQ